MAEGEAVRRKLLQQAQSFTLVGRDGVALVCVAESSAMHHLRYQIGICGVGMPIHSVAQNCVLVIHLQSSPMTGQFFQRKHHHWIGPRQRSGFQ